MENKQDLKTDLRSVFDQLNKIRDNYPNAWKIINKNLTEKEGSTTLTDADAALFYALEIIEEADFNS
ncbi:MAG: hypothetical protein AAF208_03430 [Cyanobacteria bacterium P01_A01_bin.45]